MKEKAHEYGIKLDDPHILDIDANYLRNEQTPCPCTDCHSVLHLLVTNTLLHPDLIFLGLQTAISNLNNQEINEHIETFNKLDCSQAKRIIAGKIIDLSISYCTNAEFNLDKKSTFILQYHFDNTQIDLYFKDQYIHFSLKSKIIILPGQILSLYFNFVTNTQAIPELTTNLDDNLAMSPDLHFEPNLTIQNIHLANCSQDTITLYPDTIILSLQFQTEQIIGIKRKITDILNTQLMDANIINFRFLENTASTISKLAVNSYIKDLQTYSVRIKKRDRQTKPIRQNQENHTQQTTQ